MVKMVKALEIQKNFQGFTAHITIYINLFILPFTLTSLLYHLY